MSQQQPASDQDASIARYDRTQYNVLTPTLKFDSAAPYLRLVIEEVRLDPDPDTGDFYAAPGAKWSKVGGKRIPDTLAPLKTGLLKIASAAGLVIDPVHSKRMDPDICGRCQALARSHRQAVRCGDCPTRVNTAFRWIGAVRTATGWRTMAASYEFDIDAQMLKLEAEADKKQEQHDENIVKYKAGKLDYEPRPFDRDRHIRERRNQIIAERFGLSETKALLRLIRAICHVHQKYPRERAALPFVVVRTDLAPDYSDPQVRAALAQRATESAAELFGSRRIGPAEVEGLMEQLAASPRFDPDRAEEVAHREEDDPLPTEENSPSPSEDAPPQEAAPPEEAAEVDPGAVPASSLPQPTLPATEGPAVCDTCGRPLPAARVAFCRTEAGQNLLGGALRCFACHQKEKAK